jgi:hypothetical protein
VLPLIQDGHHSSHLGFGFRQLSDEHLRWACRIESILRVCVCVLEVSRGRFLSEIGVFLFSFHHLGLRGYALFAKLFFTLTITWMSSLRLAFIKIMIYYLIKAIKIIVCFCTVQEVCCVSDFIQIFMWILLYKYINFWRRKNIIL